MIIRMVFNSKEPNRGLRGNNTQSPAQTIVQVSFSFTGPCMLSKIFQHGEDEIPVHIDFFFAKTLSELFL
jgi:hypothetical protein